MGPPSSMDPLFLHMMFHSLGAQLIITTMVAAFLVAVHIDHCICQDHLLTLVDLWWEMVCSCVFSLICFLKNPHHVPGLYFCFFCFPYLILVFLVFTICYQLFVHVPLLFFLVFNVFYCIVFCCYIWYIELVVSFISNYCFFITNGLSRCSLL